MSINSSITEVKKRLNQPKPPFFRKLSNLGLVLAGVGAAILSAPIVLPTVISTIAGYILTTGVVITSISEITIESPADLE